MQWHPNGTVTYKRMKHWYFERELSVGPLSDVVTTINVPVVGSAEFVRGSFFMEWGISDMLANLEATIFVKKTVGELLFEGYEDDVMTIGADMNSDAGNTDDYSYGNYDYSGDYYDGDMDMDLDMSLSMYDEEEEDMEKREAEETTTMRGVEDKMNMDRFGWFYNVSRHFILLNWKKNVSSLTELFNNQKWQLHLHFNKPILQQLVLQWSTKIFILSRHLIFSYLLLD